MKSKTIKKTSSKKTVEQKILLNNYNTFVFDRTKKNFLYVIMMGVLFYSLFTFTDLPEYRSLFFKIRICSAAFLLFSFLFVLLSKHTKSFTTLFAVIIVFGITILINAIVVMAFMSKLMITYVVGYYLAILGSYYVVLTTRRLLNITAILQILIISTVLYSYKHIIDKSNLRIAIHFYSMLLIAYLFARNFNVSRMKEYKNFLLADADMKKILELKEKEQISRKRAEAKSKMLKKKEKMMKQMLNDLNIKKDELKQAYERLKTTQAQLIQSEKMAGIGQLAAGVAHEINNPTGFIINNLEVLKIYLDKLSSACLKFESLIKTNYAVNDKTAKMNTIELKNIKNELDMNYIQNDLFDLVEETLEGAIRIKNIVLNLKEFAHPLQKIKRRVSLNKEIEKSLSLVWNELKYVCKVKKEFSNLPQITADPGELDQVFVNLLMNALQAFNDRKGEINIKTYLKKKKIYIEFADNGKGISNRYLTKIFDPFFTTKEVGKGTGLGLSIVYNIIKNHRGRIDVKSKVNKGTTFIIQLPVQ